MKQVRNSKTTAKSPMSIYNTMKKPSKYANQDKIKELYEDGYDYYYGVAKVQTGINAGNWITVGRIYGSKNWVESAKAGLPWTLTAKTKKAVLDNFKPYADMYLIKVDYIPTN